ncbi:MAG: hypothetical protein ACRCZ2_10895 [Fusobacteriaceae bacterium]
MTIKFRRENILNVFWNKTYIISIEERLEDIAKILADTESLKLLENKYQTRYKKLQNYMKNSKIKMEKSKDRAEKESIYRESVIHVHKTLEKMLHNEMSSKEILKPNNNIFNFLQKDIDVSMNEVYKEIILKNWNVEFFNEKLNYIFEEVKIANNLELKRFKKLTILKLKINSYKDKNEINLYKKIIELSDLRGRAPGNLSLTA